MKHSTAEPPTPRAPIANGSAASRFWTVPERHTDPMPGILRLARKLLGAFADANRLCGQYQQGEEHELAYFCGEPRGCGHDSRLERKVLRSR